MPMIFNAKIQLFRKNQSLFDNPYIKAQKYLFLRRDSHGYFSINFPKNSSCTQEEIF